MTSSSTCLEFRNLDPDAVRDIRERSIFELGKWDQQFKDKPVFAPQVMVLNLDVYQKLAASAETLSRELFAAEQAVLENPELLVLLGLPGRVVKALHNIAGSARRAESTRLCRFDFHPTTEGWKISEVNSDVPGGLLESDGLSALVRDHCQGVKTLPNTTDLLLDSLLSQTTDADPVALMHASAYTDDRQTMYYLQRALARRNRKSVLVNPDNINWKGRHLQAEAEWFRGRVSHIFRFYPGEWMAQLDRRRGCADSPFWNTPFMTNPLQSLVSQSKRFPLVWPQLSLPMTEWKARLPATQAFSLPMLWQKKKRLFKPALGRVGEGIYFPGISGRKQHRQSLADWLLYPGEWAAQDIFEPLQWDLHGLPCQPCLGIYTVNGRAAGIYGRLANKGLVDSEAQDIAVLLRKEAAPAREGNGPAQENHYYETSGTF